MQILMVSDLHYTLKQLDWVAAIAGEYDLLVVAGDLLDIASFVEPDAQIAVVLEYLARMAAKTTVIACSGNHDLNASNEYGERAARWLDSARASEVFVDGARLETDASWSRCARGGTARAREIRWIVNSPPTPRSSTIGPGSGCTTRLPTTRPRAGPASGTTATKHWARGLRSISRLS